MQKIVLASQSPFRRMLLQNAGLCFEAINAEIDERAAEAPLEKTGASPADVAEVLAIAKAMAVSERLVDAVVIGCDQTLSQGDEVYHKPADMEAARRQLLQLSGKTHQLNSAVVLVRNGELLWSYVGVANLTMRKLEPAFIGRHLARVGDIALKSVGAYQIEGEGIQLFQKIEGDYFTIVGLPLLPLLEKLREIGAIDG